MVWFFKLLFSTSSCFSELVLIATICSSANTEEFTCDYSLRMAVFWASLKVTFVAVAAWTGFLSGDFDFLIFTYFFYVYIASKSYSLIATTFYWPLPIGSNLEVRNSVMVTAIPGAFTLASRSGLANLLYRCCFLMLIRLGLGFIRCVLVMKCLYSD